MQTTAKEGIYTKVNRFGKKVFIARFKIKGKTYRPGNYSPQFQPIKPRENDSKSLPENIGIYFHFKR